MSTFSFVRRRHRHSAAPPARSIAGSPVGEEVGKSSHTLQKSGEVSALAARRSRKCFSGSDANASPLSGGQGSGCSSFDGAERRRMRRRLFREYELFVAKYDAKKPLARQLRSKFAGYSEVSCHSEGAKNVTGSNIQEEEQGLQLENVRSRECDRKCHLGDAPYEVGLEVSGIRGGKQLLEGIPSNMLQLEEAPDACSDQPSVEDERADTEHLMRESLLGFCLSSDEELDHHASCDRTEKPFVELREAADRIFTLLQQDGPGFNARQELNKMQLTVSTKLVREVLYRILKNVYGGNKDRWAKLTCKFFVWSRQKNEYRHDTSIYNLAMKVFAKCLDLNNMLMLLDEMQDNGLPVTAWTFNILICSCGSVGLSRSMVNRFLKSKNFNYRPFRNSYTAILHSLITLSKYELVQWVYEKMLREGHLPDLFAYNVLLRAKYLSGKLDQFHKLFIEMGSKGFAPDLHTYSLLLHVLGKGNKPLAALNLLNYMREVGCSPSVLHFTNVIDGLSRIGDLEACEFFYDEMIKSGCEPDVVCYTVMITGYVVADRFEKAEQLFNDMLMRGMLPNVYTYNAMIKGLCINGRFDSALAMLKDMEVRGCTPNFSVYSSLVSRLRDAGKPAEANDVIQYMLRKGHYLHLASKFRGYRRC